MSTVTSWQGPKSLHTTTTRAVVQHKSGLAAVQGFHQSDAVSLSVLPTARGNLSQRLSSVVASWRRTTTKSPMKALSNVTKSHTRPRSRRHCEDLFEGTWRDVEDDGCEVYKKQRYCTVAGGYGRGWRAAWGTFADFVGPHGHTALQVCCACGGGTRWRRKKGRPTASPVRKTHVGCECLQTWNDVDLGACDKTCCNLDNDELGEWCLVKDWQCQGGVEWGYCAPLDTLEPLPVVEKVGAHVPVLEPIYLYCLDSCLAAVACLSSWMTWRRFFTPEGYAGIKLAGVCSRRFAWGRRYFAIFKAKCGSPLPGSLIGSPLPGYAQ
mmetsp:Transcript_26434/g.48384  ORF Transcript_26434/g.48384 Transcript_26434/m.48384 type:complete len:323 (+) Transcript_26434:76-1044(+)